MNSNEQVKILVVDDEPDNLGVISGYLKEAGYRCSVASNGKTALKRAQRIEPGVILLDIMMPVMDGFEVCRRLKQNEATRSIPVIFFTVLDDQKSKKLGFDAGGIDYVTKPIHKEELLARVSIHLENYLYKNKLEQAVERRTAELKQANEMLSDEIDRRKEGEENLRITLNSIGDAVIATDTHGRVTGMNPVAEELTGWQFEAASGKPLTEVFNIVNAQTGDKVDNPVAKVIESEKVVGLANHTMLIAKDGAEYQIADSAAPIRDTGGTVTGVVLVFKDVTQDYRMREALRESEVRYRRIFDTSPVSIWQEDFSGVKTALDELEAQGIGDLRKYFDENPAFLQKCIEMIVIRDVNAETLKIFGADSKDELLGSLGKVITEDSLEVFIDELLALRAGEHFFTGEMVNHTLDGKRINVLLSIAFPPVGEKLDSVLVSLVDVTERKQAEEKLQASKNDLQILVESVNVIPWRFDVKDNQFTYVGRQVEKILGFSVESWTDLDSWAKRIHPQDRQTAVDYLLSCTKKGEDHDFEYRCLTPAGEIVWIRDIVSVRCDERDAPVELIGYMIDITERKLAEEALKESEERFRMVLQGSSIIVASFDTDLRYTWIHNPHPDFNASEVLGKRDNEIADNEGTRRLTALKQRTIDTGLPQSAEIIFPLSTRETVYTVNVQPVLDDGGKIIGAKSVSYDITERKQAEEELEKHRLHLEELVEQRTQELQEEMDQQKTLLSLMAGREVRMADLKKVIKKLRGQLDDAGITPIANDPLLGPE